MTESDRVPTGVPGLDPIVGGGLPARALYLVKGQPGTGKTTLGLQFLLEGARRGEKCLYLCLAETRGQLTASRRPTAGRSTASRSHEMRRRGSAARRAAPGYTVFSPAEVELEEISRELLDSSRRSSPTRLVLDSLSEIRLLAEDPARYRRELLALSDQHRGLGCTALAHRRGRRTAATRVAETLVSGVAPARAPLAGLRRGAPAAAGSQAARVEERRRVPRLRDPRPGLEVYPRLVAATHRAVHSSAAVPSGMTELDALLGGGLDAGTSTVLMGPAGTGKSTVAAQFVAAAAAGRAGAMFCFDESPTNLLVRRSGLGIPLAEHVEAGGSPPAGRPGRVLARRAVAPDPRRRSRRAPA